MKRLLRILLVDDNPEDEALYRTALGREFDKMEIVSAADEAAFRKLFERVPFDAVITDYNIPGSDGLRILRYVKSRKPICPVVMSTGTGSEELASQAFAKALMRMS